MAVFFTLSGFLITSFLIDRPEPKPFLIRRLLRIVPLAWVAMIMIYFMSGTQGVPPTALFANLFFFANLPTMQLLPNGGHLWSLCLEMQFYLGIALLVFFAGRRGLLLLPLMAIAITALRIWHGATINIVTWFRIDEILAGATLALIHGGLLGKRLKGWLSAPLLIPVTLLALVSAYWIYSPLAYIRPYAVAAMVGLTLHSAPAILERLFTSRAAVYVAAVSYALYVIHVPAAGTWLGSGDLLEKNLKRPLLFAVTFGLAHLSTFYFEQRFVTLAKGLTRRPTALTAI